MKANIEFINKPIQFWGYVRLLSEKLSYSKRGHDCLRNYTIEEAVSTLKKLNISYDVDTLSEVIKYMNFRADILNNYVKNLLMDLDEASIEFNKLKTLYDSQNYCCKITKNKQKNEKANFAYFTGIINILAEKEFRSICDEQNLKYGQDIFFDDDPSNLTSVLDNDNKIIFTLSRRFDGAYPTTRNPKAIWEIKEYYHTKTFGSRVADGVYETLLDGFELNQIEDAININSNIPKSIKHFYFIDDKFTWWTKGKSYLCRIIDMLHMDFVDEVMFGKEVLTEWPKTIRSLI